MRWGPGTGEPSPAFRPGSPAVAVTGSDDPSGDRELARRPDPSPGSGRSHGGESPEPSPVDPVLARRETFARWVRLGQRVGYLLLVAAIVLFVVGLVVGFERWVTGLIAALLIAACVVLPPAIVFKYGIRAANREEAEARQAREQRLRRPQ